MGKSGGKKKCGWIDRIRAEGAVPYNESQNSSNCWCSPPGSAFKVRGSDYLRTKVKIPGGEYLLQPLGFDWVKGSVKIGEILRNPNNTVRKIIAEEFPDSDNRPFIWAFNLQLPTKDNYCAVMYFASKEPFPEGSLVDKFLKGDDALRNLRLKLIANIVKGPWIVKRAVGEQAICIIGKALTCKYCVRPNFIEVDIDIGSSMVATAIVHLAFGYVKTLTVDLAFLLEGQAQSELPEKLLGALRLCSLDPASAIPVEPSPSLSSGSLQRSLSRRLWRSIGQMLLPSSQEDDSPPASATQDATKKDIDVKKW
ncbi:hypothetical protein PIB30_056909 [Stylosanthes scabra]|uniref:Protein ENHANCED DISEASE RESISTANCE 2 C-terminal domain-containing protein n=1 Tax=Stylosanthes scabra TaxID=79078 RepID=A0ABU6ZI89_9FABA|nr:hypothetical protein [Stylosanthes scabra]